MGDNVQDKNTSEEHAFILQLYCDYSRMMHFIARKYLEDSSQDCEDIVQESLIRLFKRVTLLKTLDNARLLNYIVVTVKNTAITASLRQRRKERCTISLSDLSEDMLRDSTSALDITIDRENMTELLCAINRLKPEDRLLLEGRYYLEYDDRQLAEIFGTKPANIRMRLTRVRRRLLYLMKEPEVTGQ